MSDPLRSLFSALRGLRIDLSPEDVAGAIWLAPYLAGAEFASDPDSHPHAKPVAPAKSRKDQELPLPPPGPPASPPLPAPEASHPAQDRAAGELYLPALEPAAGGPQGTGGRGLRVPTGAALPGSLLLERSLRPLRRREPSRNAFLLDVERTARRAAEERVWLPALRPKTGRWLSVALVADVGPSMGPWRSLVREFVRLLGSTGAFRDVRVWCLDTGPGGPGLYPGPSRRPGAAARDPGELFDPGRRTAILLLSDCVSRAWHDGSAARYLERWSARCPFAMVQVLPESLWSRSALVDAEMFRLGSRGPATANPSLDVRPATGWGDPMGEAGTPFPIATLEPAALGALARVLAGVAGAEVAGIGLELGGAVEVGASPEAPPLLRSPQARAAQFRRTASPIARRLAGLLAASPEITLPILRLVREAALPEARQVHEAEVLLGGLLRVVGPGPTPTTNGLDPDEVRYDFHEGVRPILLDALPMPDAANVLGIVSAYVSEHLGRGRDFRAILADPAAAGRTGEVTADRSPFAKVASEVLARLGGDHARLVSRTPNTRRSFPTRGQEAGVAGSIGPATDDSPGSIELEPPPIRKAAGAESFSQQKLSRVRTPRVQISYDMEIPDSIERKELPFVIGVLADLRGNGTPGSPDHPPRAGGLKFRDVDRDNFDHVLRTMGPTLAFHVDSHDGDGRRLAVQLEFRSLDDFHPDSIVMQVGPFRESIDLRKRLLELYLAIEGDTRLEEALQKTLARSGFIEALRSQLETEPSEFDDDEPSRSETGPLGEILQAARSPQRGGSGPIITREMIRALLPAFASDSADVDPGRAIRQSIAVIDRHLSLEVAEVLHHPRFQALESSWRGLWYLVRLTETGDHLRIRVANLPKQELIDDFEKANEPEESRLFRAVHDEGFGVLGGTPISLLVADYSFGRSGEDLRLLNGLGRVGTACQAPVLGGADPDILGIDSFDDLVTIRQLDQVFQSRDAAGLRRLRELPQSRFLCLTLPRVIGRLPYGSMTTPVDTFHFEELPGPPTANQFLWIHAAWALAARVAESQARYGWPAAIRGAEGGGRVEGLPLYTYTGDDGFVVRSPVEVQLADRREFELASRGFIPLVQVKNTDYALFLSVPTLWNPPVYDSPAATASAAAASRLNVTLAVCRFTQTIMARGRDRIGAYMDRNDLERFINDWLSEYVLESDDLSSAQRARYPLRSATLRVIEQPGRPSVFRCEGTIRPAFLLDDLGADIPVSFELPNARG